MLQEGVGFSVALDTYRWDDTIYGVQNYTREPRGGHDGFGTIGQAGRSGQRREQRANGDDRRKGWRAAGRVGEERSQRRGRGSRRSPRPPASSTRLRCIISALPPSISPIPLFFLPSIPPPPSSPFIIAGGEEDGDTINSHFYFWPSILIVFPEKFAFFFSALKRNVNVHFGW